MTRLELIDSSHLADIQTICRNLRPKDAEEIFANRFDTSPDTLAGDTVRMAGFSWIAYWHDKPVAVLGAWSVWPHHWTVFAYGTNDYRHVIFSLTRHIRSFMIPALERAGYIMAYAWVLATYTEARTWLKYLGGKEEAYIPAFGKNREDFVMMVWRR